MRSLIVVMPASDHASWVVTRDRICSSKSWWPSDSAVSVWMASTISARASGSASPCTVASATTALAKPMVSLPRAMRSSARVLESLRKRLRSSSGSAAGCGGVVGK